MIQNETTDTRHLLMQYDLYFSVKQIHMYVSVHVCVCNK